MADIFSVTTLQETLCPPKAESPVVTPLLTPFSAVVPARFTLARLTIHITLATIHEEENEEESMEVSQNSSTSFLSTCFLEVKKPLPSYSHNCKCA
ncbi:Uncharacterized protein TCM_029428 [Theobroma cacao]|uniref:Uncharacterized protein n=1 Tax=Theobroma cacao TaxID=3641 RepID=A0A061GES4_THECC|nr:Uncharacterized protein TCM_029428 [Theobroma cacao]